MIQCQFKDVIVDYDISLVQCEDEAQVFMKDPRRQHYVKFCYKHAPPPHAAHGKENRYEILTRGEYLIGVIMQS